MAEVTTRRRKLAAILMADVAGFSAMMGRDEERTTQLIQDFHERVEGIVGRHHGRVVDTAGDSVFGEFDSVVDAVRCANEIQQQQADSNRIAEEPDRILTRIGVHLGDVLVEQERIYGDGVNIAARLEQLAEPGGILISEAVYQQIHNKIDLDFHEDGVHTLKNIEHPVRVYSLPTREPPVLETRPPVPARQPRIEHAGPPSPLETTETPASPSVLHDWYRDVLRAGVFVPTVAAIALLLSGLFGLHTAGVFPTGGAILLGTMLGHVWTRRTGKRGNRLIAMGLGVALGAVFTSWSTATDGLFVLAGLAMIASGISANHSPARPKPAPPSSRPRGRGRKHRKRRRRPADPRLR